MREAHSPSAPQAPTVGEPREIGREGPDTPAPPSSPAPHCSSHSPSFSGGKSHEDRTHHDRFSLSTASTILYLVAHVGLQQVLRNPGGLAGKESACNLGDLGLIPGLGIFIANRACRGR